LFNDKIDDEVDFCEAYKSQILDNIKEDKSSPFVTLLKILTILLLLVIIVLLSIYGYNNYIKSTDIDIQELPSSIQISDEDLKVTDESSDEIEESTNQKGELQETTEKEVESIPPIVKKSDALSKSHSVVDESDIDKIANDVKIAIAQEEEKEKNKTVTEDKSITTEIENSKSEESLEVPIQSSLGSKYLEDLAELSKEIDKDGENN